MNDRAENESQFIDDLAVAYYDQGYEAGVVDGVRQAVAMACKRGLRYTKGKEILQELLADDERLEEFIKELFS